MQETQFKSGFSSLNVSRELCDRLLTLNISIPTPIQEQAIPIAMTGRDVVGIAQTGTGKTLAFGLPMAAGLGEKEIGLVLAPTRELAQQICETLYSIGLKSVLIVGGAAMGPQIQQLRNRYDVIVATPGRLMDHLQQGTVRLDSVGIAVLDEADRMLDMGFAPSIKRILELTPKDRQTMLFSATMPREIAELASGYLRNAARVEVASQGTASELVDQELIYVDLNGKRTALAELLYASTGSVLVFSRTRHGARKLARDIRLDGFNAAEIHSDRSLPQRRAALEGFKNGTFKVLVATDIAARGIDVKDISLVINFDLPDQPEDYVHRIGRTGRAGAKGRAVTLAFADQSRDVRDIEVLLGTTIRISEMSSVQPKAVSFRAPLRKSVKKAVNERRDNHPRPERPASPRPHPQTPKPAAAHPNQHPPRPPQPKSPSSGAPGKASNSKPMSFFAQKKARQAATGGPRQDNRVQKPNSRRGGR